MEIIVGKTAGFCYGVENAVKKTEEILTQQRKKTNYCLGELVHNKQVIQSLEKKGLKTIESIEQLENEEQLQNVIIRAHGVPPKIYQQIEEKRGNIIDLTCPNVLMIHKLAEQYTTNNYYVFLTGKKDHPEVVGIFGYCQDNCSIIETETEEDIDLAVCSLEKSEKKKVVILSQTTFSVEKFNKIVEKIENKLKDREITLEIQNTICNATKLRQEETEKIAKQVDCMIIIGGKNSSNTKKLYEVASKNCTNTISIETKEELLELQFDKDNKVGIMAGASTPKESIEEVVNYLQ